MTLRKQSILLVLLASLAGCSWVGLGGDDGLFRDRSDDYRKATVEPPLQLPEDVSQQTAEGSYTIPTIDQTRTLSGEFEVPRPDPMDKNPLEDYVKIQKLGSQQWIVVESTPGQIWPRIRGFLNAAQLPVARTDAANGILETDWLEPATEGAQKERYRFRIEQGVQRGSGEVYILQSNIGKLDGWPESSADTERETIMLQELAQFLANSPGAGSVSMVAERALEASGRVWLERDELGSYLRLQLPFDRAWASLGSAIRKASFQVEDLNRSERIYYVSYQPQRRESDDDGGWFGWLFGGSDNNELENAGARYQVRVMDGANAEEVRVSIQADGGEALSEEQTETLLKQIRGHIS